jgi:uncharacterized membrane protein YbhN (UPF0104 family)
VGWCGREGLGAVAEAVDLALPVLPWGLVAFEVGRSAANPGHPRVAGRARPRVPPLRLFAGQLVAHAMLNVAPAGRTTAEVTKAALISRWVGGAEAAAAASLMQAATFVGVGLVSAACAVGAWLVGGAGTLFWLLAVNAGALLTLGVGLRALLGSERLLAWVRRRLPSHEGAIGRFRDGVRSGDPLTFWPAAFLALGMGCQVLQMYTLAGAVGARASLEGAFAAQGVHLVTATAAVFVPGQLGAREAAFGLAAGTLGTTPARAASIAICAHLSQLFWRSSGYVTLLAWRRSRSGTAAALQRPKTRKRRRRLRPSPLPAEPEPTGSDGRAGLDGPSVDPPESMAVHPVHEAGGRARGQRFSASGAGRAVFPPAGRSPRRRRAPPRRAPPAPGRELGQLRPAGAGIGEGEVPRAPRRRARTRP